MSGDIDHTAWTDASRANSVATLYRMMMRILPLAQISMSGDTLWKARGVSSLDSVDAERDAQDLAYLALSANRLTLMSGVSIVTSDQKVQDAIIQIVTAKPRPLFEPPTGQLTFAAATMTAIVATVRSFPDFAERARSYARDAFDPLLDLAEHRSDLVEMGDPGNVLIEQTFREVRNDPLRLMNTPIELPDEVALGLGLCLDLRTNHLEAIGANDFWSRWHARAMFGEPLPWELQRQVALIPEGIWQAGPTSVAESIADIERSFSAH